MDELNRHTHTEIDFEHIFDVSPDPVCILDLDHKIIRANQAFNKRVGISSNEVIGAKCFQCVHKMDEPPSFCVLSQMLKEGKKVTTDMPIECLDGWFSVTASPLRNTEGAIIGAIHIARDITKRKLAEEALRKSIAKYQAIFESTGTATLIVEEDTTILMANNECYSVTGYTPDELVGQKWIQYVAPEGLQEMIKNHQLRRQNPDLAPKKYEVKLVNKKGERRDALLDISIVYGTKQSVVSILDITERKRREEKLLFITKAVESTSDAIGISDAQGHHVYQNKASSDLFEYATAKELEAAGGDKATVKDPAVAKEMFGNIMSGKPWSGELEMVTKSGRVFPAYERADAIKDSEGKVVGLIGLVNDITERKQVGKKLDESRQKFIEIIAELDSAYYSCSLDGLLLEHNKAFKRIFGFDTNQDMDGVKIPDFWLNPKKRSKYLDILMNKGFVRNYLVVIKTINGEQITVSVNSHLVKDENGKVVRIEGTFTDVTEQKQAEDALRKSEERYRTLTENIGEGVGFINEEEIFVYANPSAERIFGVSKGELTGLSLTNFLCDENIEIIKNETQKRRQGESSVYESEIVLKDGSKKYILGTATPHFDDKKFIGTFAIFRDITDRKLAEEEIKRKNEELQLVNAEKDKFFSIIAHDLRSPFNSFLGLTQIMSEQLPAMTLEQIQKIADSMRKSANNLYSLLENLLEWSLLQRGVTTSSPMTFQLMPKLSESLSSISELASKKEIGIDNNIPENLTVYADEKMFESIIRNLSSNAVKFTPKGGKISFTAKPTSDDWIEISIQDTGIGMSQEVVKNLFKLDADTSRKGTNNEPSTGLGLIICKEFVEKHGGKLWVESEEGKGSTFYFVLPAKSSA